MKAGLISRAADDSDRIRVPSRIAAEAYADLMALPPGWRREFYAGMDRADFTQLLAIAKREGGSTFALWQDDPVGFNEDVLGESLWSIQAEVLAACAEPGIQSIIVPAGFGLGKTHVAGGAVVWFCSVWPVGTAGAVTTATRMRQVSRQLWPHVRRLHAKARLPGICDTTQWKMPNRDGVETVVAYGFTAPDNDESAMQGIHFPRTFLVVDEAGGIGRVIGSSTRNLLTGDARMLAIGNPPTDNEGSWFEGIAEDGDDPEKRRVVTIPIPATSSPGVTGEYVVCRACPPEMPAHGLGDHLVNQTWIDDAIDEHGAEAPYVIAKVDAKFPKGGAARAIPSSYVDAALEAMLLGAWWDEEDMVEGQPSLDREGRPYPVQPPAGAAIKLGVDVASDGGDELVISRLEGDIARIRHTQSGAGLDNSVTVAGIILEEIRHAEALAVALGSPQVRVKVDAIGVGWGVVSTLEAWGAEGIHNSVIVRVTVSEAPDKPDDPKAQWRPANKRAEMWLNGRELLKPDVTTGRTRLRLDVDKRTAAQLRTPLYGTNASGKQVIEKKADIKARVGGETGGAGKSPDRAEAVLLAAYEPKVKRKARVLA